MIFWTVFFQMPLDFITMGPSGVIAKVLNCALKVSESESQSCYSIYLQTNTFGEKCEPSYPNLQLWVK